MCHVLLNDCVTGIKVQSSVITSLDSVFNLLTFTEFGGSMASLFLVSVLGLGKKKEFQCAPGTSSSQIWLTQPSLVWSFNHFIGRQLV